MPNTIHLTATTDLNRGVSMQVLKAALLTGDQQAHRFTVACTRSAEPVSLSGAKITGYFLRADGTTVVMAGVVEAGCAAVTLPAACYAVPGRFSLVIKAGMNSTVETIYWAEGAVNRSQTDVMADPGEVLPTLEVLLARIEAMETAADEARSAAHTALEAAAAANAASSGAIIPTAEGRSLVHVPDASSKSLQALRVYGRTVQKAEPSPGASAPPVSPGDAGSLGVTITGKNLFNKDAVVFAVGLINSTGAVDTSITYYMHTETYIPVKPNTAYVFSGDIVTIDRSNSVAFYDEDKAFIARYASGVAGQNSQFTTPAGCCYIRFNAAVSYNADTIQLEAGNVATAYEPYAEQTVSMATAPLRGVKVTSGGNYTDESSQTWLADCIDSSTGTRVTNIPQADYNGSNCTPVAANDAGTAFQLELPTAGFPFEASADQSGMVFSNRLPTLSCQQVLSGEQGIAINGSHALVCVSGVTTAEDLLSWLTAVNLTVVFRPAEPLNAITSMTEAEAGAWQALHTYQPNTTLYCSSGAWIALDYVADLKSYIDNRIASIAALL